MVCVNPYKFGTVALFATLFAAIHVNGEKGCVINFENAADFDLTCKDAKNSWTINEDVKDSPQKKVLILSPEEEGCLKSKNTVILNSTSSASFRFYHDSSKDEKRNLTIILVPKGGNCSDEECVWDIASDASYKPGEWVTAEHDFPLKSMKECHVQVQAGKSKGKLLLDSLIFRTASVESSGCRFDDESLRAADEAGMNEVNLFDQLAGSPVNDSKKNFSPSFKELSKNLMLTSASVLTLNNLLN